MIFVGYEPGSKGYQFWDAAHQCFKISHDVKSKETLFPAKEVKSTKSNQAPQSDLPICESDNESNSLGLELVTPAQPPSSLPSPGLSASRSNKQTHPNQPIAPPVVPQGAQPSGSGQGPAIPEPPNHDTPFVLLRNDWLTKLSPLETISILY